MTVNKFLFGIVLLFTVAFSRCTSLGTITPVGKLLIDTDIGGDDVFALLMALKAEKLNNSLEIIGITCVHGNTYVDQVAMNVLKSLKIANRLDIPVYTGASHPLLLPTRSDFYFGKDGFGDFYYPEPPSADLIQSKHAVNAMIDLVKAHPGKVTLLALGPLTNVALAIKMYPSFLDELQQLIIMGGSTEGHGNRRPGVEFNFSADPVANYIVFKSSTPKPAILIPFDTTQRTRLRMKFRMSLGKSNDTIAWLLDSANTVTLIPEKKYWNCADAVAAAITLTSGSIVTKSRTYYSETIYDGTKASGMIVVDYTNITGNPANTHLIQAVDEEAYKELVSSCFSS